MSDVWKIDTQNTHEIESWQSKLITNPSPQGRDWGPKGKPGLGWGTLGDSRDENAEDHEGNPPREFARAPAHEARVGAIADLAPNHRQEVS